MLLSGVLQHVSRAVFVKTAHYPYSEKTEQTILSNQSGSNVAELFHLQNVRLIYVLPQQKDLLLISTGKRKR